MVKPQLNAAAFFLAVRMKMIISEMSFYTLKTVLYPDICFNKGSFNGLLFVWLLCFFGYSMLSPNKKEILLCHSLLICG